METSEIDFWLNGDTSFSLDYKYKEKIYKTDLQSWRPDPREYLREGKVYQGEGIFKQDCSPLDEVYDKLVRVKISDIEFSIIR